MNRILKILFTCVLGLTLLFWGVTAAASFEELLDVSGHWAEPMLERAYTDGYLTGFEDSSLRPDAPISKAELLTILCRVLQAEGRVDASYLGLTGEEWYAETAQKAEALGLLTDGRSLADSSLTRLDAARLLTKAFQLSEAAPDEAPLKAYKDVGSLSFKDRASLLALMRWGGLQGYGDHSLRPGGSITRAEFMALLYRLVPNESLISELAAAPEGGLLLSGKGSIKNLHLTDPVYLDCSTETISLWNSEIERLTLRSQKSGSLQLDGGSVVHTLVLGGGDGTALRLSPSGGNAIGTLVVGDFKGDLTLGGKLSRLEVTGSGQIITVTTQLEELVISGSGNQLRFSGSGGAKRIILTTEASLNYLSLGEGTAQLQVDGSRNTLSVGGRIEALILGGSENQLGGSGSVGSLTLQTKGSTQGLPYETLIDNTDRGIEGLSLSLVSPATLPVGETLTVTAHLNNPLERRCKVIWTVNGTVVKEEAITVGPNGTTATYQSRFRYHRDMNTNFAASLSVEYLTRDGELQTASAEASTLLENYSQDYYDTYEPGKVLSRVTTGYKGDYTLAWAQKNDYDQKTKEIWINTKGYGSKTKYLIWINIAYQRVNIFEGSSGKWTLSKSYLVGTGAKGTDTPVGVYTVGTRTSYGWTTAEYNVRPVLRFKMGSGLAFHSRIYDPKYTRITDPSIGFPVSHGCIRMYDGDVWWMYDNIPEGTTVVVY